MGTNAITIFKPFFAPIMNDSRREYVPGNKMLLPIVNPAAPAINMADISRVPCIQIVRMDSANNPYLKKKYWNVPSIIPF